MKQEIIPKVILHYLDNSFHTVRNAVVERMTDWEHGRLEVLSSGAEWENATRLIFPLEGVMAIESVEKDYRQIWTNPKYSMSVKTDITTSRQRMKSNNWDCKLKRLRRIWEAARIYNIKKGVL